MEHRRSYWRLHWSTRRFPCNRRNTPRDESRSYFFTVEESCGPVFWSGDESSWLQWTLRSTAASNSHPGGRMNVMRTPPAPLWEPPPPPQVLASYPSLPFSTLHVFVLRMDTAILLANFHPLIAMRIRAPTTGKAIQERQQPCLDRCRGCCGLDNAAAAGTAMHRRAGSIWDSSILGCPRLRLWAV